MLVFLFLLLLLWYTFRDRSAFPLVRHELKPHTEIHAPGRQEADLTVSSRTLDYGRAAGHLRARNLLEQAEREFDSGRITAAEFHRKASPLVTRLDLQWIAGPDAGL